MDNLLDERTLQATLLDLFEKDSKADVMFVVGDKRTFKLHKAVFTLDPSALDNLTQEPDPKEIDEESGLKVFKIQDISPEAFKQVIKFWYSGAFKKNISIQETFEAHKFACKYDLKTLTDFCLETIEYKINSETCVEILNWSYFHPLEGNVYRNAFHVFTRRINEMINNNHFQELDFGPLRDILKYNLMTVQEILLFEAVVRWSKSVTSFKDDQGRERTDRRAALKLLVPFVKFLLMTPKYFLEEVIPMKLLEDSVAVEIGRTFYGRERIPDKFKFMSTARCSPYDDSENCACHYCAP